MKKGLALLLTLCLLLIPGCSSKKENVIKIVDGRVTEQKLVHRMIKMLVEDRTDLTVSIGEEMTAVNAYNEMKKRVYDVYMSYDGTVLTTFLHRDPSEGRHLTDSRRSQSIFSCGFNWKPAPERGASGEKGTRRVPSLVMVFFSERTV